MKIFHSLSLAAALIGGGVAAYGDDAKADKPGCCGGECCAAIVKLTTEDLAKIVAEKKAVVIDVNAPERYAKGHVPGAKNVAFDKVTEKDLPADKTTRLVFYCANEKCNACEVAAKAACELGYKNIAVYRPGIMGWEAAKQATEKSGTPS